MYNSNTRISYFRRATEPNSPKPVLIFQVYQMIVGEGKGNDLREKTEDLRAISDPDPKKEHDLTVEYKRKNFPCVSFGGEFSKRGNDFLTGASNLVCLDIDGKDQNPVLAFEDIAGLRQRISGDTELDPVLIFRSPSGNGLKIVVNIKQEISDDKGFKRAYNSLENYVKTKYGLISDRTRKDISGLCYLPYDGEAVLRDSGEGFDVEKWATQETPKQAPQRTVPVSSRQFGAVPSDYERAVIAVEDIERSGICLTDDYHDWRDIGFALSNLGESGRDLFHRLASMSGQYNPNTTDRIFTESLNSSYQGKRIELETLFKRAGDRGVQMRPSNVYSQEARKQAKSGPYQANPHGNPSHPFEAVRTAQIPSQGQSPEDIEKQRREFENKARRLLERTTEQEVIDRESALPDSLITGYQVTDEEGFEQKLPLLSGKLTAIAGATGHGKTLWLMNLLLNVAKQYPEKRFILFTYEENSDTILEYLLNIYLDDLNLMRPGNSKKNRVLLKEYFTGHGTESFGPSSVGDFNVRKSMFFRQYIENGRILIKYVDSDSTELCQFLDFLSAPENNIGGVFVDYFQCINPDPEKRFPTRQEALKSICFELKDIANRTGLPVALACQFNQEVLSPCDVLLNKIGEAGDISRIVSECWGLWQMGKDIGRNMTSKEQKKVDDLNEKSDEFRTRDPFLKGMFLRVLKSRIVETGAEGMFEYRGLTGKISPNDPDEKEISVNDWERV